MNIMIMAAHPDDAEIAIGGTMLDLSNKKHNIYLLNFTNGEPTPRGTVEKRLLEAKKADKILKVKKRIICDFPNRYLEDKIEYRNEIAKWIRKYKPKIILAPYHIDAHPDHIAASALSVASRFYAKLTKTDIPGEPYYPEKIFFYFISHMKLNVNPTFIYPVSKQLQQKKILSIKAYKSQFSHRQNDITEKINAKNKYFGSLINSDFGEPFFTPEAVMVKDFNNLI